jgi:branched-chain amino acid transport system substrate-binding protein
MTRRREAGNGASAVAALAAACAIILIACSGGGTTTSTTPTTSGASVEAPASTAVPGRADGQLTLGALLPRSGPGATLGEPLVAAVELAVSEINAAGGINQRPVLLVTRDEGANAGSARRSLGVLLERDVDAIIGPASSRVALSLLTEMLDPGLTVCSPTNTAISLSRFPDRDHYFRTIPSDALQAAALAQLIERTGRNAVAIVYIDDEFGLDFATALTSELVALGITVSADVAYEAAAEDLTPVGIRALGSGAPAIAVIGDPDNGGRMLATLRSLDSGEVEYFVNDSLRLPSLGATLGTSASFVERLQGLSPSAAPTSETFRNAFAQRSADTPIEFAGYAYDCTILLALAATVAGSDDPSRIAEHLVEVSRGGSPCSGFAECARLIGEGLSINYEGASGGIEFDDDGDVRTGTFEIFKFGPSGLDIPAGDVDV